MADQPFYHRIDGFMFTATRPIDRDELIHLIAKGLKAHGVIPHSVDFEEYHEPEAGDPHDL